MYHLYTTIEISASPNTVREKFLDFSQLPTYHPNGFFKSIKTAVPDKAFEPGVKLHNVLEGMTIEPTLIENSATCFRWGGTGLLGTFSGEHIFRFEPSTKTQGGTTFVHEEKFTGLLSFIMGHNPVARGIGLRDSTQKGFERYNRDLKVWCEKL
ncbi:hypothetical protein Dda_9410 [Drechslerella dactyloides]|uniref:Uncharacterized protein n=1 Tax=Drechslerella dactyloides TaxID=74499 RepID=A0AAD6IPA3_DREDA|nr:hypothetical protein Dda_9410 [Drechslerella dactyloides]